ncbi:MAG: hypothetical protein PHF17_08695 [Arcobacteraceae bacterium]|nr:hypothetical protein [Arcobacteraceae bacterium]
MKKYLLIISFFVLFFNGCSETKNTNLKVIQTSQTKLKEPLWLDDPQKEANGKLTAVGCASRHINGEVAQKKLALQRAIDEIAMQKKTKVQTVSYNTKIITESSKTSQTQTSSLQEVQNVDVSTKVMEYYTKPDGDICVWVVEN